MPSNCQPLGNDCLRELDAGLQIVRRRDMILFLRALAFILVDASALPAKIEDIELNECSNCISRSISVGCSDKPKSISQKTEENGQGNMGCHQT